VPISAATATVFEQLQKDGTINSRVRAVDFRHLVLVLPYVIVGLFRDEVAAFNEGIRSADAISDPSVEIADVCLALLEWYHLLRRKIPSKDCVDIDNLARLGRKYVVMCKLTFPYSSESGRHIMCTDKHHFMVMHATSELIKWGDIVNTSAEAPEAAHKKWIKAQGGQTNQGPSSTWTMLKHSVRKEAASLLSEAVQGRLCCSHLVCIDHIDAYRPY
jgi:hypothetical protein